MKLNHGLPSDWSSACLGKLARLQAGGTPDRKEPSYWGGDIPWVGTAGINFNWIDQPSECITKEGLAASSAKVFPSGTILMAMIGQGVTRGKVATLRIEAATNQNCVGIVPSDKIDSRFLFHFLASRYSAIRGFGNSGGVSNMNASMIREIEVPIPPFCEGRKVGEIFDLWDRAIELTEKLIAAKQKCKQALMQQLLTGKVRFKEFKGKPWKEVKLGKLFKERRETGYLELPLLSITSGEGIVYRDSLDRKDSSNADKSKYLRICPGDIGYNTMRMWQGVSALSDHEGIVSPAYTILTPNSDVDPLFMSYLFKYPPLVHVFWRYSQGMVDDTLNLKFSAFSTIKVQVPSRIEQERIATVLAKTDAEITFHTRKAEQLRQQKKGLMQKLLTGKVRVSIDS